MNCRFGNNYCLLTSQTFRFLSPRMILSPFGSWFFTSPFEPVMNFSVFSPASVSSHELQSFRFLVPHIPVWTGYELLGLCAGFCLFAWTSVLSVPGSSHPCLNRLWTYVFSISGSSHELQFFQFCVSPPRLVNRREWTSVFCCWFFSVCVSGPHIAHIIQRCDTRDVVASAKIKQLVIQRNNSSTTGVHKAFWELLDLPGGLVVGVVVAGWGGGGVEGGVGDGADRGMRMGKVVGEWLGWRSAVGYQTISGSVQATGRSWL